MFFKTHFQHLHFRYSSVVVVGLLSLSSQSSSMHVVVVTVVVTIVVVVVVVKRSIDRSIDRWPPNDVVVVVVVVVDVRLTLAENCMPGKKPSGTGTAPRTSS